MIVHSMASGSRKNLTSLAAVILDNLRDDGFSQAAIVDDCQESTTIIDGYDGIQLIDGQEYLISVVAYDDWLNVDLSDVDIVTATPNKDTVGNGESLIESPQSSHLILQMMTELPSILYGLFLMLMTLRITLYG